MGRSPDFIGIGAQKAGTSWIYSCLYEHPQICIPVKEVHFFSRDRNWVKGFDWYESVFGNCPEQSKVGEFSTSYLSHPETPKRIGERYPNVRLIASLRNPADRAYSNYLNQIIAGQQDPSVPFQKALSANDELIEQGRYASHLSRFLRVFPRDQILLLIYEESLVDPAQFIKSIYRFVGVEDTFTPRFLTTTVNRSAVPRAAWVDRFIRGVSSFLRSNRLHTLWWAGKRMGLANLIRSLNTKNKTDQRDGISVEDRRYLNDIYSQEILSLEDMLGRPIEQWRN